MNTEKVYCKNCVYFIRTQDARFDHSCLYAKELDWKGDRILHNPGIKNRDMDCKDFKKATGLTRLRILVRNFFQ